MTLCLQYWRDGQWFVGRLAQVPFVFSQGSTLEELEDNIRDAYRTMVADAETESTPPAKSEIAVKDIEVAV